MHEHHTPATQVSDIFIGSLTRVAKTHTIGFRLMAFYGQFKKMMTDYVTYAERLMYILYLVEKEQT